MAPTAIQALYQSMNRVIAHRGASAYAPENTASAIRLAALQGARWAEVDITISCDGVAVIHHDDELHRTSDGEGWLIQKPLSELKQLDMGAWYADDFSGERILTLTELLQLAAELDLSLNLEVKPVLGREQETVVAIAEAINEFQQLSASQPESLSSQALPTLLPTLLLSSFNPWALTACSELLPHLPRALNVDAIPSDWAKRLRQCQCQSLHFNQAFADSNTDAEIITALKQADICLAAFTVNHAERAEHLLRLGVDAVFSDHPQLLQG